jgi:signal peptidase
MYSIGVETIIPIALLIVIGIVFCFVYAWYISGTISDIKSGKADIELLDEAIYENLSRVKKRKKISKTINSIVFYGLLICIAPSFVFAMVNKAQGNLTLFGDKGILVVATPSMSQKHEVNDYLIENNLNNQFNAYDIIVIEAVDSDDDLKLYDVITFVNPEGRNIIHRIIKIETDKDGNVVYTTRGDYNNTNDSPSSTIANIKGKYTNQRIQYVGAVILFFQSTQGIITLAILAICLMINDKQMDKVNKVKNERLNKFQMIDYKVSENGNVKYQEEIYYDSIIYCFNDKGFIEKKKNNLDNEFVPSENELIKVYKEENLEPVVTKFIIEREM